MTTSYEGQAPRIRFSKVLERGLVAGFKRIPAVTVAVLPWVALAVVCFGWYFFAFLDFAAKAEAQGTQEFVDFPWHVVPLYFLGLLAMLPAAVGGLRAVYYKTGPALHWRIGKAELCLLAVVLLFMAILIGLSIVFAIAAGIIGGILAAAGGENGAILVILFLVPLYIVYFVAMIILNCRYQPVYVDAALNGVISFEGFRRAKNNVWAIFFLQFLVSLIVQAVMTPVLFILFFVTFGDLFFMLASDPEVLQTYQPSTLGLAIGGVLGALVFSAVLSMTMAINAAIFAELGGRGAPGVPSVADDLPLREGAPAA